jgi:hypothetical protein
MPAVHSIFKRAATEVADRQKMSTTLVQRAVRFDGDGLPWSNQSDPVLRGRVRQVYCELCESGETGQQIVAVRQEIVARLDAIIESRKSRNN